MGYLSYLVCFANNVVFQGMFMIWGQNGISIKSCFFLNIIICYLVNMGNIMTTKMNGVIAPLPSISWDGKWLIFSWFICAMIYFFGGNLHMSGRSSIHFHRDVNPIIFQIYSNIIQLLSHCNPINVGKTMS